MKKLLVGFIGLSLLLLAAAAFARPIGMGLNAENLSVEQKQFFEVTRDLRKEMHDKRFQLRELYRSGADQATIEALESDLKALRVKIQARAAELGVAAGPGACGSEDCNAGQGCGMGKATNCNGSGACGNQQANAGCGKMSRCGQQ